MQRRSTARLGVQRALPALCGSAVQFPVSCCSLGLRVSQAVSRVHVPGAPVCGSLSSALQTQVRHQSAASDKKFHCSICKKAFRLEMAAKVHVQQAHNGEGMVEAGTGPGQADGAQAASSFVPPPNAPPQRPTVIEEVVQPEERQLRRRGKPTPKPLHEPYHDVPAAAMEEMLGVWDAVGVRRLAGSFVHSSMVMKVFAARPDAGSEPLYDPVAPEGDNPFAAVADGARQTTTGGASVMDEAYNIYSIDLNDAFAMATGENYGPFRVARCDNPFGKGALPAARTRLTPISTPAGTATASPAAAQQGVGEASDEPQTAPVTPYGQLPMFGQQLQPPPAAVGSPFTGDAAPVAGGAAAAAAGLVASPFGSSVADSPFAQHVTSPFVASPSQLGLDLTAPAARPTTAAASPFATAGDYAAAPSPFTSFGADSPFASLAASPFAASPFTAAGDPSASGYSAAGSFPPYQPMDGLGLEAVPEQAAAAPPPQHECESCGKTFSSYDGMRMHAKTKHSVELPRQRDGKAAQRVVPELPAYIPSPVNLSMTTPFGKRSNEASWAETEIIPHAVSVSNITIAGKVLEVERIDATTEQISVFVAADRKEDCETVSIRWCHDGAAERAPLRRNDCVFVSGTLRLLPIYEPAVNKYYSTPVVFVSPLTGILQKID